MQVRASLPRYTRVLRNACCTPRAPFFFLLPLTAAPSLRRADGAAHVPDVRQRRAVVRHRRVVALQVRERANRAARARERETRADDAAPSPRRPTLVVASSSPAPRPEKGGPTRGSCGTRASGATRASSRSRARRTAPTSGCPTCACTRPSTRSASTTASTTRRDASPTLSHIFARALTRSRSRSTPPFPPASPAVRSSSSRSHVPSTRAGLAPRRGDHLGADAPLALLRDVPQRVPVRRPAGVRAWRLDYCHTLANTAPILYCSARSRSARGRTTATSSTSCRGSRA